MKPANLGIPGRDVGLSPAIDAMARRVQELERRLSALDGAPLVPMASIGRTSDSVTLERQRVRDRALDETYFHMAIEPGVGATFAGITVDTATYAGTVFDMPAGATSAYRRTARMRGLWPRTTLVLTLWYTSDVGSMNLFSMTMLGRQIGAGNTLAAYAAAFTSPFTIPGPAVANTVLKATYRATAKLLASPELFSFTLARLAPDANANALRIVYGDLRLEESA